MKARIIKLNILVFLILLVETLITGVFVGLAAYRWEWLINVNFVVGYVLFITHLIIYWIRNKMIIKRFRHYLKHKRIFAGYLEKRSYVHNKLILYTSFFAITISMLANIVFIFGTNDDDLPLDILSFISAALVLAAPFLGNFYKKIILISQTEGDMEYDALKNDIKYCVFNTTTLHDAIKEIAASVKTQTVVREDDDLDSDKILDRLNNRIDNIRDEIALFENYLMFETVIKELADREQIIKFKTTLMHANNMKDVFDLIKAQQA